MVRVRRVAQQEGHDESLLGWVVSPLREALQSASQLNGELNQSMAGAYAARKLMPGAVFILLLPMLFVVVGVGVLGLVTHLKAMDRFGPTVTWTLEALLVVAVVTRAVIRFVRSRRPAVEPLSEELLLSPTDVEAQLASGLLRPSDLVHDGTVWGSLQDSPQFEFACDEPLARLRLRRRVKGTVKFLAWATVLLTYVVWLYDG